MKETNRKALRAVLPKAVFGSKSDFLIDVEIDCVNEIRRRGLFGRIGLGREALGEAAEPVKTESLRPPKNQAFWWCGGERARRAQDQGAERQSSGQYAAAMDLQMIAFQWICPMQKRNR